MGWRVFSLVMGIEDIYFHAKLYVPWKVHLLVQDSNDSDFTRSNDTEKDNVVRICYRPQAWTNVITISDYNRVTGSYTFTGINQVVIIAFGLIWGPFIYRITPDLSNIFLRPLR